MSAAVITLACMTDGTAADTGSPDTTASENLAPPGGMRVFVQVLINTAVANLTTSSLWFALTF